MSIALPTRPPSDDDERDDRKLHVRSDDSEDFGVYGVVQANEQHLVDYPVGPAAPPKERFSVDRTLHFLGPFLHRKLQQELSSTLVHRARFGLLSNEQEHIELSGWAIAGFAIDAQFIRTRSLSRRLDIIQTIRKREGKADASAANLGIDGLCALLRSWGANAVIISCQPATGSLVTFNVTSAISFPGEHVLLVYHWGQDGVDIFELIVDIELGPWGGLDTTNLTMFYQSSDHVIQLLDAHARSGNVWMSAASYEAPSAELKAVVASYTSEVGADWMREWAAKHRRNVLAELTPHKVAAASAERDEHIHRAIESVMEQHDEREIADQVIVLQRLTSRQLFVNHHYELLIFFNECLYRAKSRRLGKCSLRDPNPPDVRRNCPDDPLIPVYNFWGIQEVNMSTEVRTVEHMKRLDAREAELHKDRKHPRFSRATAWCLFVLALGVFGGGGVAAALGYRAAPFMALGVHGAEYILSLIAVYGLVRERDEGSISGIIAQRFKYEPYLAIVVITMIAMTSAVLGGVSATAVPDDVANWPFALLVSGPILMSLILVFPITIYTDYHGMGLGEHTSIPKSALRGYFKVWLLFDQPCKAALFHYAFVVSGYLCQVGGVGSMLWYNGALFSPMLVEVVWSILAASLVCVLVFGCLGIASQEYHARRCKIVFEYCGLLSSLLCSTLLTGDIMLEQLLQ